MAAQSSSQSHIRKTMPAITAALFMTAVLALVIVSIGLNALFNRNTVPLQASAASPQDAAALNGAASTDTSSQDATVQQLQSLIAQYQSRETQYQTQLQQAADQINQLTQQNQQYQSLIDALQNAGVIQINQNGQVFLNRNPRVRGGDDNGGG
jgi:flagellar motor protein MotB